MKDCIFCKIIAKEIPAKVLYEDNEVVAIHDIAPQAPAHVLVIPKKHIKSLNEATEEDQLLLGKMLLSAQKIAKELEIDNNGYRLIANTGRDSGQTVWHLHMHILGGRDLGGKMV